MNGNKTRQRGVGLIEVMIAVLIISVGLLGIAKTLALSIANTAISGKRSIAAIEAASLAAMMHANENFWAATTVPASVAINGTTISDATLSQAPPAGSCETNSCTPAQVAALDVQGWAAALAQELPGDVATVTCQPTANPVTCTIQVNWIEHNIAMNSGVTGGTSQQAPYYTLYVQP